MQTSYGFGVPLFDYQGERTALRRQAEARGEAGLLDYWTRKNLCSIDGDDTGLLGDTTDTVAYAAGSWFPLPSCASHAVTGVSIQLGTAAADPTSICVPYVHKEQIRA